LITAAHEPLLVDLPVPADAEYAWARSKVELAYGLVLYDDRDIRSNQNPSFNGHYELAVHLITAGYRFSF
jgi:hypothetical protein